ncbi:MAG: preprotein translocase subunit SecG [Candidatus Poribacteria bacterium]|nr:preprotein translocase subunit SecG [Candidatus Poribacteria bacterium]
MPILEGTLTVLFVIVCVMMILAILIQPGKGEGLGAIAGMSTQTFGGAGPTSFLSKLTAGIAVAYMVLVIALGRVTGGGADITPATQEPEIQAIETEDSETEAAEDAEQNGETGASENAETDDSGETENAETDGAEDDSGGADADE